MITVAIMCMALNVYHEARGEDYWGQVAVAQVVMNRMKDKRWPDDVCSVISQKHQFSHTRSSPFPKDTDALKQAIQIARLVVTKNYPDPTGGATHYFNPSLVAPGWAGGLQYIMTIGNHAFYK